MKLTQILYKQHIGKFFVKHWMVQGKQIPHDLLTEKILLEKSIPVVDPKSLFMDPNHEWLDIVGMAPKPIAFDKTHPDWHNRVCHTFKDNNVLLEGLDQSKVLTKTVEIQEGLPEKFKLKKVSKDVNNKVKNIILYSHLFNAEQQKLPKLKDPLRPAWNFPRVYGVSEQRVNKLIVSKLLHLTETLSNPETVKERQIFNDMCFSFPFEKAGDLIQLQLKGDTLLTSSKPLSTITREETDNLELPNLFPIKETITFNLENIYQMRNIYPISKEVSKSHPHTVFVHFNGTEVANLFEEEVTEPQILGRTLLKTFTVAAAYAKQRYGESVTKLPQPITVQGIQTDGRLFHFGVLQLNTLDLEGAEGTKNIWYQTPRLPLFTSCKYELGKPTLLGYNTEVIKHLMAFYENV